jgi:hypothetical protein
MKTFRHIQWAAAALAVMMMVGPYPLYAAVQQTTSRSQAVISDIRLASGGLLEGRLVNSQALPVEQASVAILHDGLEVARARTDANGAFQVAGLRGGVHQIAGPSGTATCRLWQQGMAPPSARESAVVITRGPLVRGQQIACQNGCPTGCNNGCRTVCQTVCPPGCQPSNAQQAVASLPNGTVAAQPVATTVGATNSKGQLVQYQEAVPGAVQGPQAGPYGQVPANPGRQTWGWNPHVRDLLIAVGIAAAIAIPIAIANSGGSGS